MYGSVTIIVLHGLCIQEVDTHMSNVYIFHLVLLSSADDEYGWWFSQEDDIYDPLTQSDICKGYEESLQVVHKVFEEQVCTQSIVEPCYLETLKGIEE